MRRKARSKLNQKVPLDKPFNYSMLGSVSDPCFGKGYDATNTICQSCGDSEFCAIVMSQNLKTRRLKIEKANVFVDAPVYKKVSSKKLGIFLKPYLKGGKTLTYDQAKEYAIQHLGLKPSRANLVFKLLLRKNKKFKLHNQNLYYNGNPK
jgi:hypothetical protein